MARVLLLFGGQSAEHEVSCASAVSVFDALEDAGHRAVPVGIDRDGHWFLADSTDRPFRAEGRSVELVVPEGSLRIGAETLGIDVAFPVLHGPKGEDGTVQGLFEVCGLPYVGCGVTGSAISMDKHLAKRLVAAAGVDTAKWQSVRRSDWVEDPSAVVTEITDRLSMPVFVKPSAQGSSIGISRVGGEDALKEAIATAFRYDDTIVVENGVTGREIEVAVLDGPKASLPGEVIVATGWYTYDAKYDDASSRFEAPADLSKDATDRVRKLAETIFTTLGLNGLARIDFFYEAGSGAFLFNEANTMPGFTSISGFPKMWLASGMTYPQLCDALVVAAFERHDERAGLSTR